MNARLTGDQEWKCHSHVFTQQCETRTIQLLTTDLATWHQQALDKIIPPTREDIPVTTISTILLLWHLEVHYPERLIWRLHLRAAQTFVSRYLATPKGTLAIPVRDGCTKFLLEELYCTFVFPMLTFAGDAEVLMPYYNIKPIENRGVFIEYLEILHHIMIMARQIDQHHARLGLQEDRESTASAAIAAIMEKLATVRNCAASDKSDSKPHSLTSNKGSPHNFTQLVNAWCYACLIYACRVLKPDSVASDTLVEATLKSLLNSLSAFREEMDSFPQDQMWPLFIAGTEVRSDNWQTREWIVVRLRDTMTQTWPVERYRTIEFLRDYWAKIDEDGNGSMTWINYAQLRTTAGNQEILLW